MDDFWLVDRGVRAVVGAGMLHWRKGTIYTYG